MECGPQVGDEEFQKPLIFSSTSDSPPPYEVAIKQPDFAENPYYNLIDSPSQKWMIYDLSMLEYSSDENILTLIQSLTQNNIDSACHLINALSDPKYYRDIKNLILQYPTEDRAATLVCALLNNESLRPHSIHNEIYQFMMCIEDSGARLLALVMQSGSLFQDFCVLCQNSSALRRILRVSDNFSYFVERPELVMDMIHNQGVCFPFDMLSPEQIIKMYEVNKQFAIYFCKTITLIKLAKCDTQQAYEDTRFDYQTYANIGMHFFKQGTPYYALAKGYFDLALKTEFPPTLDIIRELLLVNRYLGYQNSWEMIKLAKQKYPHELDSLATYFADAYVQALNEQGGALNEIERDLLVGFAKKVQRNPQLRAQYKLAPLAELNLSTDSQRLVYDDAQDYIALSAYFLEHNEIALCLFFNQQALKLEHPYAKLQELQVKQGFPLEDLFDLLHSSLSTYEMEQMFPHVVAFYNRCFWASDHIENKKIMLTTCEDFIIKYFDKVETSARLLRNCTIPRSQWSKKTQALDASTLIYIGLNYQNLGIEFNPALSHFFFKMAYNKQKVSGPKTAALYLVGILNKQHPDKLLPLCKDALDAHGPDGVRQTFRKLQSMWRQASGLGLYVRLIDGYLSEAEKQTKDESFTPLTVKNVQTIEVPFTTPDQNMMVTTPTHIIAAFSQAGGKQVAQMSWTSCPDIFASEGTPSSHRQRTQSHMTRYTAGETTAIPMDSCPPTKKRSNRSGFNLKKKFKIRKY